MLPLITLIGVALCLALLVWLCVGAHIVRLSLQKLSTDVETLSRELREFTRLQSRAARQQATSRGSPVEQTKPVSRTPSETGAPSPERSALAAPVPPSPSGKPRLPQVPASTRSSGSRDAERDIVELYNSILTDAESEESWNLEFQHVRGRTLGVSNASERQIDHSLAPIFVENDNGYLDILPVGTVDGEYYAFPRARLPLDRKRWNAGGFAAVYRNEGDGLLDAGETRFKILQPARMRRNVQSGHYETATMGLLRFL
jgi:hypothetical protein